MSFLLFCIYIILILNIFFNFQFMTYKKTTFEQINDMGIGYNLGKTYNCCHIISDINNEIISYGLYCILCINQEKEFWIKEKMCVLNKYSNFWKQIDNEFIDMMNI